jgi:1,4-alpha-glucan branching enzyme
LASPSGINELFGFSSMILQEGWYDDRPRSFLVYAPCRTAVVYALADVESEPVELSVGVESEPVELSVGVESEPVQQSVEVEP